MLSGLKRLHVTSRHLEQLRRPLELWKLSSVCASATAGGPHSPLLQCSTGLFVIVDKFAAGVVLAPAIPKGGTSHDADDIDGFVGKRFGEFNRDFCRTKRAEMTWLFKFFGGGGSHAGASTRGAAKQSVEVLARF